MGHGFMMAPVVGRHLADVIAAEAKGKDPSRAAHSALFEPWKLRRFKEGKLLSEGMIIG
jgi:sarcosine oxidase subunit beta